MVNAGTVLAITHEPQLFLAVNFDVGEWFRLRLVYFLVVLFLRGWYFQHLIFVSPVGMSLRLLISPPLIRDGPIFQELAHLILVKAGSGRSLGLLQLVDSVRNQLRDISHDILAIFHISHMVLVEQVIELLLQICPEVLGLSIEWNTPRLRPFRFPALLRRLFSCQFFM